MSYAMRQFFRGMSQYVTCFVTVQEKNTSQTYSYHLVLEKLLYQIFLADQ